MESCHKKSIDLEKKGKTVAVKSLEKNPTPEEIIPDHDGIMMEKVKKIAYEKKYYTAFGCYKMYVKEKQKENNNIPSADLQYLNSVLFDEFMVIRFLYYVLHCSFMISNLKIEITC